MSLQKKVTALQTEREQNHQDITSKDREIREKSDRIANLRDKMDVLEVELSLERIRSDGRVKELEETTQKLEENKDRLQTLVSELELQIEELKESTETLEIAFSESITQKDEKIKSRVKR